MDSDNKVQDAPPERKTAPSAVGSPSVDEEVTFERYAHDFVAQRQTPLVNALRAHLGVRKSETATRTFKRSELDAELAKLTAEKGDA